MKRLICFLLIACLLLAGCGKAPEGTQTSAQTAEEAAAEASTEAASETAPEETLVSFTDDHGRELSIPQPKRVVTLIASFADVWCLAGGAESLVGVTNAVWTYYDLPLREDVVNLGTAKELNLEALIDCQPELVLASCGTDRDVELEETIEKMGIPAAYFSVNSFEDYLRMLEVCTELTGKPENYGVYGLDVQEAVDRAIARADGSQPRVLYIRATGSSCKVKGSTDTVLGQMLRNLGCRNIADGENTLLEQLSMEAILQENPDHIFVVLQSADPKDAQAVLETTLLNNPAWQSLTAVQEGRYYVMDPNLYNLKPNGRWGEAYEKLADILYPQG